MGGTAIVAAAYLLGGVILASSPHGGRRRPARDLLGRIVFGPAYAATLARVEAALTALGYATSHPSVCARAAAIYAVAAYARSPHPADWRAAHLQALQDDRTIRRDIRQRARGVGEALRVLGSLPERPCLRSARRPTRGASGPPPGVADAWWRVAARWAETSALEPNTRRAYLGVLRKVGRWLARHHPTVTVPAAFTRAVAVELVGDICHRWTAGAYAIGPRSGGRHRGAPDGPRAEDRPLAPASIVSTMAAVRTFLGDYVAWEWATLRFAPARVFVAPRAIAGQVGPNPRDIDATLYAKLLHGALTLTTADLPRPVKYPLAMVRAAAVLWTQAGLRANELGCLTVGCVRWEPMDKTAPDGEVLRAGEMAFLTVPDNKTSRTFVKAVAPAVGRAVLAWEAERRAGDGPMLDAKSRRPVEYLFVHRGGRLGAAYLNRALIPLLCRKMGLPAADAKGRITSHRARATMATLLLNAPDGMTLTELAAWLGHRTADSTTYYAQITPLRQAQAVKRASRALVEVDVILDLDRIERLAAGTISDGQPAGLGGRRRCSSTISVTGTATTSSSASARTGWPARGASTTSRSRRPHRSSSNCNAITSALRRRSRCDVRNWRPWRGMGTRSWPCSRSCRTSRRRVARPRENSARRRRLLPTSAITA